MCNNAFVRTPLADFRFAPFGRYTAPHQRCPPRLRRSGAVQLPNVACTYSIAPRRRPLRESLRDLAASTDADRFRCSPQQYDDSIHLRPTVKRPDRPFTSASRDFLAQRARCVHSFCWLALCIATLPNYRGRHTVLDTAAPNIWQVAGSEGPPGSVRSSSQPSYRVERVPGPVPSQGNIEWYSCSAGPDQLTDIACVTHASGIPPLWTFFRVEYSGDGQSCLSELSDGAEWESVHDSTFFITGSDCGWWEPTGGSWRIPRSVNQGGVRGTTGGRRFELTLIGSDGGTTVGYGRIRGRRP